MTSFLATALLVSAFASPAGGFVPSGDELKCGIRPGAEPGMPDGVTLLDHEVYDGDVNDLMAMSDDIAFLAVVCWRWVELNYGVRVRVGGSHVLTKAWIERTRGDRIAALEALVAAQDRHRERTGRYASRIEELADFGALSDYGLPSFLVVDLNGGGDAWNARLEPKPDWSVGNHERVNPVYRCFAFAGEVPAGWDEMRRGGEPGPRAREPACYKPFDLDASIGGLPGASG